MGWNKATAKEMLKYGDFTTLLMKLTRGRGQLHALLVGTSRQDSAAKQCCSFVVQPRSPIPSFVSGPSCGNPLKLRPRTDPRWSALFWYGALNPKRVPVNLPCKTTFNVFLFKLWHCSGGQELSTITDIFALSRFCYC
jgi:hypothetical protein